MRARFKAGRRQEPHHPACWRIAEPATARCERQVQAACAPSSLTESLSRFKSELLAKSFSAGDLLCATLSYAPGYAGAQDQASGAARIF